MMGFALPNPSYSRKTRSWDGLSQRRTHRAFGTARRQARQPVGVNGDTSHPSHECCTRRGKIQLRPRSAPISVQPTRSTPHHRRNNSLEGIMNTTLLKLVASFAVGAAAMCYLDPATGRRRRALARDKGVAVRHDVEDYARIKSK